jgi:hypothetical protein
MKKRLKRPKISGNSPEIWAFEKEKEWLKCHL